VAFTRNPDGLRRALEKLDADSTTVQHVSHATSHLWIESPDDHEEGNRGAKLNDMFNTHPPLSERINLLRSMEGLPPYQGPEPDIVADLERRHQRRETDPETFQPAQPAPVDTTTAAASMDLDHLGQHASAAATHAQSGWYTDPGSDAALLRYWDGKKWTNYTARR
jgi:hypothetical protein